MLGDCIIIKYNNSITWINIIINTFKYLKYIIIIYYNTNRLHREASYPFLKRKFQV